MNNDIKKSIKTGEVWLRRHGGSIITVLQLHERRIKILERRLKIKGKRGDRWAEKCDAPRCNKKRTFECGENVYGQTGGWCSQGHFKQFAKH